MNDWVEAQMAIVEIMMAPLDQALLPEVIMPAERRLYERVLFWRSTVEDLQQVT